MPPVSPAIVAVIVMYAAFMVVGWLASRRVREGSTAASDLIVAGRLRLFVDDVCLGQTTLPSKEAVTGVRLEIEASKDAGKLWIDELLVSRSLPTMPRPDSVPDQDSLWLEHGEQQIGRAHV